MLFYDDEIDLRGLEDIKFDAEKFSAFMDSLAQDIDGYTAKARNLVSGYGKYYHNETYGGRAADASKEFIANGQMDKLHVQNHNVQKDLFKACIDTKEAFEEMVDPSPKARISREALRQIKKDHQGRYEEMDMLGHEIEGMVREVMADFSDLTNFEYFDANPVREIYDEFSGNGGHVDKCIRKLEMFDEQSKAIMNQAGIIDKSELLQNNIRNTAGALDAMKVYNPSISKNSVGLVAFGANASYLDNGLASLWNAASLSLVNIKVKIFANDKEAAEYLDSQMKLLCDDDNSNDAAAITNINATVQGFLYMEVTDGKKYVAYDQKKIEGTLKYLEKGGLAYQLLSSVNEQINTNKKKGIAVPDAITKLGIGGRFENTKLEIRKDGAGVRLEVTSNNDLLPLNELDHKYVAYAATEESAKNYFMNGSSYDWDAISDWYRIDDIKEWNEHKNDYIKSVEFNFLAFHMKDMSDSDIEKLIMASEYSINGDHVAYDVSPKLKILANEHMIVMDALSMAGLDGKDFNDKYTRAVLINYIEDCYTPGAGDKHFVKIGYTMDERDIANPDDDEKIYFADITSTSPSGSSNTIDPFISEMNSRKIVVYPYGGPDKIESALKKEALVYINELAVDIDLTGDTRNFIIDQTAGYVAGLLGVYPEYAMTNFGVSEIMELKEAYETNVTIQGVNQMANYEDAVKCMQISGETVHIYGGTGNKAFVHGVEYNDKALVYSVEAYNIDHNTEYTISDMKEEFIKECNGNSDVFDRYNSWYINYGADASHDLSKKVERELGDEYVDSLSAEELEEEISALIGK